MLKYLYFFPLFDIRFNNDNQYKLLVIVCLPAYPRKDHGEATSASSVEGHPCTFVYASGGLGIVVRCSCQIIVEGLIVTWR